MKTKQFVSVVSLVALVVAVLFTPNKAEAQTSAAAPAAPACTPPTCAKPKPVKNQCSGLSKNDIYQEKTNCEGATPAGTYDSKLCDCAGLDADKVTFYLTLAQKRDGVKARDVLDNSDVQDDKDKRAGLGAAAAINGNVAACGRVDKALKKMEQPNPEDVKACDAKPGIDRSVRLLGIDVKDTKAQAAKAQADADEAKTAATENKAELAKLKDEHNALSKAVLGAEIACAAKAVKGKNATLQEIEDCNKNPGLMGRLAVVEEMLERVKKLDEIQTAAIFGTLDEAGNRNDDGLNQRVERLEGRVGRLFAFLAKWQLRGGLSLGFNGRLQPAVSADNALMRGNSALEAKAGIYLSAGDARLSFSGGRTLEEIKLGTGGTGKVAGNAIDFRGSYLPWKPAANVSMGASLGFRHGETNVSPASGGAWALATGVSPGVQLEAEVGDYLAVVLDLTVGYDWVKAENNGHDAANPKGVTGSFGVTFVLRTPVVVP